MAEPGVVASLQELGFAEPKFGHGRIISKPPHSPQLYWCAARTAVGQLQPLTTAVGFRHRDGRFWNDPASSTPAAMQVFLMFYLTDTSHENKCLQIVPNKNTAAQQSAVCVL